MENFVTFTPVTVYGVKSTITSAPSKSCDLDHLPTIVLKEFLPELLSFPTEMRNKSISQPWLTTLSTTEPVSCHRHAAPEKDKFIFQQHKELQADLQPDFYDKGCGKTGLSSTCCIFGAARSSIEPAVLLDLSAASNTVDHEILLNRLQTSFGIHEKTLSWRLTTQYP